MGQKPEVDAAASVLCRRCAENLLRTPCPAIVKAIARRADELRFTHPDIAPEVSAAAVCALDKFNAEPALEALVLGIHGTTLRSTNQLDVGEAALICAARAARAANDPRCQAEVARRLASLRAEQGRPEEARKLIPAFLDRAQRLGGRLYGKELANVSALLIYIEDYERAYAATAEALRILQPNGDRWHLSAVFNLCRCCLELATTQKELEYVSTQAQRIQVSDDYTRGKLLWLRARIQQRRLNPDSALELLEAARPTIEATHRSLDKAILLVDLAGIHLDRGEVEEARRVALEGFPLLGQLKGKPEAFRALRLLQRAAEHGEIDAQIVESVRRMLEKA